MKKYTYDYQGKFFGVHNKVNGEQRLLKVEKKYGDQSLLKNATKNP